MESKSIFSSLILRLDGIPSFRILGQFFGAEEGPKIVHSVLQFSMSHCYATVPVTVTLRK